MRRGDNRLIIYLIVDVPLIEPTVVNGGILEVKSEFLSNGLVFTGSAKQETTRMPSIRIPKGLLNERSDGQSMSVTPSIM